MRTRTSGRRRATAGQAAIKCRTALRTTVLAAALPLASVAFGGCGGSAHGTATATIPRSLLAQARTIGPGPRFQPSASGPVLGACRARLGRRIEAHVEVFAENHVVLIAEGIGTRPPRMLSADRITGARCYGALVTLDPTGVVLVRAQDHATLAELFRSWGEPLSATKLAGFAAQSGAHVSVYLAGRALRGAPVSVPLTDHAELVLEVGPHVPPHRFYTFPPTP